MNRRQDECRPLIVVTLSVRLHGIDVRGTHPQPMFRDSRLTLYARCPGRREDGVPLRPGGQAVGPVLGKRQGRLGPSRRPLSARQ
jgi:hypothetical protein